MIHTPPRILAIDDTPANLLALGAALAGEFDLQIATSGATGLALARESLPDLILLDVMMPGMDGFEVCQRLKSDPSTQHIPVIFVSAMSQPEDQERGFALGAADYITKPFQVPLVLARVRVHVRLKLKSEALEKMAFVDGLTDIPNRRALERQLEDELRRARRGKTPLSVLMIDIDHFKAYNDSCGHGTGDICLRKVAHELKNSLMRPGDFIARFGGEEFCAVLPDCDADGAALVAEKMRQAVEALHIPHPDSAVGPYVTISLGCATGLLDGASEPSSLVDLADQALYRAKGMGRNRVVCHTRS